MTFGHGIETPHGKIASAGCCLALAVRLLAAATEGHLSPEIYTKGVTVSTSTRGVRIPPHPSKTKHDLELEISNLVIIALGASAAIVDDALDDRFGPKDPEQTSGLFALRSMVYQLRNAFAHNPLRPKWKIKEKYCRKYEIELNEGKKFLFDATSLDGKPVEPHHVGDLDYWGILLEYCESIVAE